MFLATSNRTRRRDTLSGTSAHSNWLTSPLTSEIDETVFAQQQPYMTELGAGIVDWPGWAEAMSRTPGAGTVLIELDEAADPVAALRAGRAVVEEARAWPAVGDHAVSPIERQGRP